MSQIGIPTKTANKRLLPVFSSLTCMGGSQSYLHSIHRGRGCGIIQIVSVVGDVVSTKDYSEAHIGATICSCLSATHSSAFESSYRSAPCKDLLHVLLRFQIHPYQNLPFLSLRLMFQVLVISIFRFRIIKQ
ncbi:hypothetical protein NPIL_57191 [Nephila pilipes]|uniref:Uncharacterized protein n=1 Tax=Nephila pilipes TaxID=299642 RepID=A0A8X6U2D9_NEPPI|nr:hypothetical protein NPIL_57191 [Nephila pilipes]